MALTMGKKSVKYRKISQSFNLKQSLNSQKLLQESVSLEDDPDICDTNPTGELHQGVINQIDQDFMQAQSIELNDVHNPITNRKNVTQTKASAIVMHVEKGTQADNIHNISSVSCNTNILKKQHVLTQYNIADFSSNANVHAIKAFNILLHALQKDDNFSTFALLLEEHEQTTKFVKLVSILGTHKMKMSNMS